MKLVRIEDYSIVFDDELLLLKPFRELYESDSSKDKENFIDFLTMVYFVYDPRSDYGYIADESERIAEVAKTNKISLKKLTAKQRECIELYKSLTQSTASKLLEDVRYTVNEMRIALRQIDFSKITDDKDRTTAIKTVASTVSMIPKIISDLANSESAVMKETNEKGRARGSQSKTIMDDGILV